MKVNLKCDNQEDYINVTLGCYEYCTSEICEKKGIQGRVICSCVVDTDGSITDVQVKQSVDPNLDREAVRVIQSMPKWTPGKENGLPVRVRYTIPITFRLQ